MDLGGRTHPEVNSIHHDGEHPLHSPDTGRKRKLQLEQLALPMSKHRFRHQCRSSSGGGGSGSERGSSTAHHLVPDEISEDGIDETETGLELHKGPEQIEGSSSKGSSSSSHLEGSDSTMALDIEGHVEMSPKIIVPRFEPSASPSSPQVIAFKDSLYSLDSRIVNNKYSDCQLPVFDADNGDDESDCQLPVSGVDDGDDECMEEGCPHGPIEELMLSCEDVALNTLGLSSARWSIKQDALPGAGRPTIDQEFEQYFSMFML